MPISKELVPGLEDVVSKARYIGPYIGQRMNAEGIRTVEDLCDVLRMLPGDLDEKLTREEVKIFLKEITMNARGKECVNPGSKVVEGSHNTYLVREHNFRAYNAVLSIWRKYVSYPQSLYIPRRLRGCGIRAKYPKRCSMQVL